MNVMRRKIILLNAPKGSGKDTIGSALSDLTGCVLKAFKTPLYDCAYPLSRCKSREEFDTLVIDRELKEKPVKVFYGMSPRNFLIYVSENIVKPNFGCDFFGRKAVDSISVGDFERGVVFTDSGFISEAKPLVNTFKDSVYVVQFVGQGSESFDGDSRDFINVPGAKTIKLLHKNENITPVEFAKLLLMEVENYGRS